MVTGRLCARQVPCPTVLSLQSLISNFCGDFVSSFTFNVFIINKFYYDNFGLELHLAELEGCSQLCLEVMSRVSQGITWYLVSNPGLLHMKQRE